MAKIGIVAIAAVSIFVAPILARPGASFGSRDEVVAAEPQPQRKQMQFYADEQFNVEGTDTIIMLHNVVFHHNGAVVVCDSAVRYSENRFECFGDVIINQDSTYIYCQRATYDRQSNIAQVFDDLIKIVSGTSQLYTYNFSFNTLDSLGRYWGGGTMLQDSNRMESDRGWYHTGKRNIYASGGVQLTSPEYRMISDSVRYNTDEQVAEFYTKSYIWNGDDILSADAGMYFHKNEFYDFTKEAYILTKSQELWADSLTYSSITEDAIARSNIQMRDEDNQAMAFGDYGEYYGLREEGFLTRNPSVASFDREAPEDTLYMRSDSMFIFSVSWDSVLVAPAETVKRDDFGVGEEWDFEDVPAVTEASLQDSTVQGDSILMAVKDVEVEMVDSLRVDGIFTNSQDSIIEPEHDSLQRVVLAYNNVKMWRRDFQAVCDSMVGFSKDSTGHMYINPVLWNEQNQLTASVIDIYTRNQQIERAVFTGDPLMVAEVGGQDYNQIKGREMESRFRNNEIHQHHVEGNAQTLYYMVDDGETSPHTLMMINSARITFTIDSQQVTKINWGSHADYVGYPIDNIPPEVERFFEGFKWEIDRRPTREEVFDRAIKPSQREFYMAIPQPQFPITQRIEEDKRRMIAEKVWEERYELLPQAAIEWLQQNVNFGQ